MNERKLALNVTQLRYIYNMNVYMLLQLFMFFLNILTRLDIEKKKLTDI